MAWANGIIAAASVATAFFALTAWYATYTMASIEAHRHRVERFAAVRDGVRVSREKAAYTVLPEDLHKRAVLINDELEASHGRLQTKPGSLFTAAGRARRKAERDLDATLDRAAGIVDELTKAFQDHVARIREADRRARQASPPGPDGTA